MPRRSCLAQMNPGCKLRLPEPPLYEPDSAKQYNALLVRR
jgi:hypothetical protein